MRKYLVVVALLCSFAIACDGNFCLVNCDGGQSNVGPSALPSASASPSPSASPSATPDDPCMPTRAGLNFHSSPSEDRDISAGKSRQLDFTPFKGDEEIPASCNRTRFPAWAVETVKVSPTSTSNCSLTGTLDSYIPMLVASTRVGDHCVVRAVLSVPQGDKIVKFEAAFEAVVR